MDNKERKRILSNRLEHSTEYSCHSIKQDENGNEQIDPYFTWSGCDVCNNGLGDIVFDVVCLKNSDIKNKQFDNVYEFRLCNGCLCSMVNGEDSDLD